MRKGSIGWSVTLAAVCMAWGAHLTAVGRSWASPAPLLILALIVGGTLRRWWKKPGFPILLGAATALVLIFIVETCLGISAVRLGPLYPPGRAPTNFEGPLIEGLAWFYARPFGDYVGIVGLAVPLIFGIVLDRSSKKVRHKWIAAAGEQAGKLLEYAAAVLAVLQFITFANAVDLDAHGLNTFVARYRLDVEKLGSIRAAMARYQPQVRNLEALETDLNRQPPVQSKALLDATSDLIQTLRSMEDVEQEKSALDEVAYDPAIVEQGATSGIPTRQELDAVTPPPPPDIGLAAIRELENYRQLRGDLEQSEKDLKALEARRAELLDRAEKSLLVAIVTRPDLGPEGNRLAQAVSAEIVRLVADKGIDAAAAEIRARAEKLRGDTARQRTANSDRRTEIQNYRDRLRAYLVQERSCLDIAVIVADFLTQPDGMTLARRLDPVSPDSSLGRQLAAQPLALLTRPAWTTGRNEVNDKLAGGFEADILRQIYGSPVPDARARDYRAALDAAYRKAGGNVESSGYGFLRNWIGEACANGVSPVDFLNSLRAKASQLPQ